MSPDDALLGAPEELLGLLWLGAPLGLGLLGELELLLDELLLDELDELDGLD